MWLSACFLSPLFANIVAIKGESGPHPRADESGFDGARVTLFFFRLVSTTACRVESGLSVADMILRGASDYGYS